MTITIVNKYKPTNSGATIIYCGRGSALGNTFPITPTDDRNAVCEKYKLWLPIIMQQDTSKGRAVCRQLHKIRSAALKGNVELQCFCAPLRCHCETIKRIVEETL